MRDDLHHSLPQTSPWRKAVKAALSPGLSSNLAEEMTRAAWVSAAPWRDNGWGKELRNLLSAGQSEMFGQQEQLLVSLEALERSSPDHSGRRACEIARAMVMSGQTDFDQYSQVMHAALEVCVQDGIEHAAARVAAEHPKAQAAELRRRMFAELPKCNLSQPPSAKPRPKRKSVEDGLRIPLPTNF